MPMAHPDTAACKQLFHGGLGSSLDMDVLWHLASEQSVINTGREGLLRHMAANHNHYRIAQPKTKGCAC